MASTGFAVDDGSRIMQQSVHIHTNDVRLTNNIPRIDLASYYNIDETVSRIMTLGFRCIALQFPDAMLTDATHVQFYLRDGLNAHSYEIERMFVLGDTSYGSCCVDEVAAQHLMADCVVHYGRACLSPTSALPVIYVFGNAPCKPETVVNGFESLLGSIDSTLKHIVMFEPCFQHEATSIAEALTIKFPSRSFIYSSMLTLYHPGDDSALDPNTTFIGGMTISLPPSEVFSASSVLLYVGKETAHLTNILLRAGETPCISYNPETNSARVEGAKINRTLNRRYFLVQKAKEAQIIGILMGTLGIAKCLDVVSTLQDLIAKSGRKSYTFVVGKINVPKLSNFAEIDAFCLVACAENTLLDSSEFFKPVITPYELQLALTDDSSWTANYKADFQEVLPTLIQASDEMEDAAPKDEPYFSLVTGKYHQARGHNDSDEDSTNEDGESSQALVAKEGKKQLTTYRSEAADFLAKREYRGLDPRVGETTAHAAVQGSSGIARGTTNRLMRLILSLLAICTQVLADDHTKLDFGIPCDQYPQATNGLGFNHTIIADTSADFIALHFTDFSLPSTDYILIRSLTDPQIPPVRIDGHSYRGDFHAPPISTRSVSVELYTNTTEPTIGCHGFSVVGYESQLEGGEGSESICGSDDTLEVACFNDINPIHWTMYLRSGAVSRIVIRRGNQAFGCTGFLIGSEGHMITNNHCIQDATDASNTRVEFLAQATTCPPSVGAFPNQTCDRQLACPGEIWSQPITFITTSQLLDYTLVKLNESAVRRYSSLKLRPSQGNVGEPLYVISHPLAWGKRMEYKKGGTQATMLGMKDLEILYNLDTRKMSSGSPILSLKDHSVVALHHAGSLTIDGQDACPNYGIRSDLIVADLRAKGMLPADSTIDYL